MREGQGARGRCAELAKYLANRARQKDIEEMEREPGANQAADRRRSAPVSQGHFKRFTASTMICAADSISQSPVLRMR
jgi:hypothetical protein